MCGVFGVWTEHEHAANLTFFGLYALQHRGQEGAGIAVSDGGNISHYKDVGLVSQIFNDQVINRLEGNIAVGHTRYSTSGDTSFGNIQPSIGTDSDGNMVALAHNGNITNLNTTDDAKSDSVALASLLTQGPSIEKSALRVLPNLKGAFSLVFMQEDALFAARDPNGIRPLMLGKLDDGWAVASEQAALDIVGAEFVREVEQGELLRIDKNGLESANFATSGNKMCLFEYIYIARPDADISNRNIYATRIEIGKRLSQVDPVDADIVIPVPESGVPAAIGYARGSGIQFGHGFTKNPYVGRTFIQPTQKLRQQGIRLKLNALKESVAGKRVIVVDDSIVRGNTQREVVKMLREAGAVEVHVRISSPPVKWPCFYGVDFPTKRELIASDLLIDEIRTLINADSLSYTSLEDVIEATEQDPNNLCTACFTGNYPV